MTAALKAESIQSIRARHTQLVNDYQPLVRKVAYRVLRRLPSDQISVELDDLVNIGVLGLFDADTKYDPGAGQSFESFAEFRIRGAMLDELRKRDFFPRRLRAKANKLNRAETALRKSLGREPSEDELAQKLELDVDQLRKLRRDTRPYSFVDEADPAIQLRADACDAFEAMAQMQRQHKLVEAIENLSEREQLVLDLYYNQEMSQRDIAQILELTEGRISQIKSAALKKLRNRFSNEDI